MEPGRLILHFSKNCIHAMIGPRCGVCACITYGMHAIRANKLAFPGLVLLGSGMELTLLGLCY